MRKSAVPLLVLFVLLSTFIQTTAQSPAFHQNDQVVLKTGILFAWLRSQPTSNCACVEYEITSTKRVLRILDTKPTFDGVQNWWHVSTVSRPIKQGWIEENSLKLLKAVPTATTTPNGTRQARIFVTNAVQIRDGVPFIWIRSSPSSTAAILQTVKFSVPTTSIQCLTLATIGPVVRWDGHQWWRTLISSTVARSDIKAGWVEENSLVDCNAGAASATTPGNIVLPSPTSSQSGITQIPPTSTYAAFQPFEHGMMIWFQDTQMVYVLFDGGANFAQISLGGYSGWLEPTDVPPAGRFTPVNAFGKVWNGAVYAGKRYGDTLGWATTGEQGYTATVSSYIYALAAKPDSITDITLPDGRTVEMEMAFPHWSIK